MNILLEKSLINSHCHGLDSIVVKDGPGMIRIFIARGDHMLWKNEASRESSVMSVAMHKHHCDVTLMPIRGSIFNVHFGSGSEPVVYRNLQPFVYRSPINSDVPGGFEPVDSVAIPLVMDQRQIIGPLHLRANWYHTIYVPYGESAAWWVWEGKEDPDYTPVVWSNDTLATFSFEGLNQPMTEERLIGDLALIGVKA